MPFGLIILASLGGDGSHAEHLTGPTCLKLGTETGMRG